MVNKSNELYQAIHYGEESERNCTLLFFLTVSSSNSLHISPLEGSSSAPSLAYWLISRRFFQIDIFKFSN